jgi:acyl-CoA ligase (AMP-forming) (exosortase A-associated)
MSVLLHQLIHNTATLAPQSPAIGFQGNNMSYAELANNVTSVASGLLGLKIEKHDRVAVFLPKQFETVIAFFSISQAGGVFVPINPLLKSQQVEYILENCNARILITSKHRLNMLRHSLANCPELHTVILVDEEQSEIKNLPSHIQQIDWQQLIEQSNNSKEYHRVIETDMVSILYTSGSTGKPKGVVLSHLNMVAGAESVVEYLDNTANDRLLAVLPFSFDYGFSQLTTAFYCGASVVLMDYMLPNDITRVVEEEKITGLAAVPTLWMQLKQPAWSAEVKKRLRYITNSGGVLPVSVIESLRNHLPDTDIFLMYGFTEAFRSTYLPPTEISRRPDSIGKAIPNAEIMLVNEQGLFCGPNEHGELVHRGPHVALGYWNDPEKTAECFRPLPGQADELPITEIAAWSGDTIRMDDEGFLYFVERKDAMIKTSGYRVSPSEIEEIIYESGLVSGVVAFGIPHAVLGQSIQAVITVKQNQPDCIERILYACKQNLPNYMLPQHIEIVEELPKTVNGKIDRQFLQEKYQSFAGSL